MEVIVEIQEGGPLNYHDPGMYSEDLNDKIIARKEAEEKGADPCPACFSDTEHAEKFDVSQFKTEDGSVLTFTRPKGVISDEEFLEELGEEKT